MTSDAAPPDNLARFPEIEPYAHGLLEVGDGNRIYWETSGNPDGKPALVVHGGLDLSAPLGTAWELARVWPDARLRVIGDSGHTGSPELEQAVLRAVRDFGGNAAGAALASRRRPGVGDGAR